MFANAWEVIGGSAPPRWWMGAWLTYRKMATVGYVPNSDIRALLAGKYPYDYVFNFTLAQAATGDARIVTATDFYILALLNTATREATQGSFRAQFYVDYGGGYSPSDRVINQLNYFGTAQQPAWLRVPFFIPAKTPVTLRVQNMDLTHTNVVQIVLHGLGG